MGNWIRGRLSLILLAFLWALLLLLIKKREEKGNYGFKKVTSQRRLVPVLGRKKPPEDSLETPLPGTGRGQRQPPP